MPDASAYNVHDVIVSEVPTFTAGGTVKMQKRVQFFVGSHGPFIRLYDADAASTQKIQSDINSQVEQLRIIDMTGAIAST